MGERNAAPTRSSRAYLEATLSLVTERLSTNRFVFLKSFLIPPQRLKQIVLYVVSRVVSSFLPRAHTPRGSSAPSPGSAGKPLPPDSRYFTLFAALSWGAVMWLYNHRGQTIQPGMFNSMTYLYKDSDKWKNLKTLLWHNT